jgi:hypothetical protein
LLPALLPFGTATALEGSTAMLETSREHASVEVGRITRDIFNTTVMDRFHVVTSGRFLRHFEYPDRRRVYQRFHDLLLEDGIGIVDVPNPKFENGFRDKVGREKFGVDDVFESLVFSRRTPPEWLSTHALRARVKIQIYEGQAEGAGTWCLFEKLRRESDPNNS